MILLAIVSSEDIELSLEESSRVVLDLWSLDIELLLLAVSDVRLTLGAFLPIYLRLASYCLLGCIALIQNLLRDRLQKPHWLLDVLCLRFHAGLGDEHPFQLLRLLARVALVQSLVH